MSRSAGVFLGSGFLPGVLISETMFCQSVGLHPYHPSANEVCPSDRRLFISLFFPGTSHATKHVTPVAHDGRGSVPATCAAEVGLRSSERRFCLRRLLLRRRRIQGKRTGCHFTTHRAKVFFFFGMPIEEANRTQTIKYKISNAVSGSGVAPTRGRSVARDSGTTERKRKRIRASNRLCFTKLLYPLTAH